MAIYGIVRVLMQLDAEYLRFRYPEHRNNAELYQDKA
jgi:hypothetical protein